MTKTYRIWDLQRKAVISSRDIKSFETKMIEKIETDDEPKNLINDQLIFFNVENSSSEETSEESEQENVKIDRESDSSTEEERDESDNNIKDRPNNTKKKFNDIIVLIEPLK